MPATPFFPPPIASPIGSDSSGRLIELDQTQWATWFRTLFDLVKSAEGTSVLDLAAVAFTLAQRDALVSGADTTLHFHATDRARSNHTGTQGPATISPQGSGSGLDADQLDAQHGTFYLARANHTGTQLAATISDFAAAVDAVPLSFTFTAPASLNLTTGTGTGSITDIQTPLDGNTYHITEVIGTPGYSLTLTWDNITSIIAVQIHLNYDGTASHTVELHMFNYISSAWDTFKVFVDTTGGMTTFTWWLPNPANYINGGNHASARIRHVSAGNAAHNCYVDYAAIIS